MFKKPFRGPEERICKECNEKFIAQRPVYICKTCLNAKARLKRNIEVGNDATTEYIEKVGRKSTDLEGIGYEERKKQWYKKASWLERKVKERSEWQAFFREEFDRIRKDEKLWESITRDTLGQTKKKSEIQEGIGAGRPVGTTNKNYKYPDTRNMSWYDYEALGLNKPEDD